MRKGIGVVMVLIGCTMMISFWGCPHKQPQACQEIYLVTYSGENEIPPNGDRARGHGTLIIYPADSTAIFSVFISPIDSLTGFHFHLGTFEENGPVIVTLYQPSLPFEILSRKILAHRVVFAKEDFQGPALGKSFHWFIDVVRQGMVYSNAHTVRFPPGATRGQVLPFD